MKKYQAYKDSGVEWIGEIPSHWLLSKVKYQSEIFGRIGYRGYTVNDIVDKDSGVVTISPSNIFNDKFNLNQVTYLSFEKYHESPEIQIFENDIILVKTGSTIGKTSIIPRNVPEMTINPQLVVLKKLKPFPKYLYYQTTCDFFKGSFVVEQTGSSTPTISQEKIYNFPLLSPPLPEQQQIVTYLDRKTQQIDDLIQHKETKIELLKEKRTSLINHVVTKGLDPNVEMKDSGVEWIGEVPSHWEFTPLKRMVSIGNGRDYKHIQVEDGGYPVLGTGGVFSRCSDYLHIGPSVLLGRKGTIDKPLFIEEPFWTSDTIYFTVINENKIIPKLLFFLVHQIPFGFFSYGSAIPSMTKTDYEEMRFPVAPMDEQKIVLDYIILHKNEIDELIELEQDKIKLLKEYRQSLISEVVTGKIRVCEEDLSVELKNELV
jgi:type I restriction enzyme S subunit